MKLRALPPFLLRGDAGRFRKCLHAAGFDQRPQGDWGWMRSSMIFSDPRKDMRRVKLWHARSVFDAPQKQQQHLKQLLLKEFGKRFISAKFIDGYYRNTDSRSLVIYLSKV